MSSSIAGLLLGLWVVGAPTAGELMGRAAQAKKPAKASLYLDVAAQQRLGGADRLRAARLAAQHGKDDKRLKARLWEARVAGVLGRKSDRRRALSAARAEARRLGRASDVEAIEHVTRAEAPLLALLLRVEAARRDGTVLRAADRSALDSVLADRAVAAAAARLDDVQLEQLLRYATALSADDKGARAAGLLKVGRAKGGRDAAPVAARALWHLADEQSKDVVTVETVEHAIAADHLSWPPPSDAVSHPAPPYIHARSARTHKLCVALAASGTRCADLEQKAHRTLSFYDFSAAPPLATFDPARAEEALHGYDVLLQRCIQQGARDKEKLTQQTVVELEWALGQDGRVPSYDLRPTRLRGTVVDSCLKEAFALFRHPRYRGELQHMRLNFDVRGPDL